VSFLSQLRRFSSSTNVFPCGLVARTGGDERRHFGRALLMKHGFFRATKRLPFLVPLLYFSGASYDYAVATLPPTVDGNHFARVYRVLFENFHRLRTYVVELGLLHIAARTVGDVHMITRPFSLFFRTYLFVDLSVAKGWRTFTRQRFSVDSNFILPLEGLFLAKGPERFHYIRTMSFVKFVSRILGTAAF